MKLILQKKNTNDCGVCCVAMLVGVPFEGAREAFSSMNEDGSTKQSHIRDALKSLGLEMSGRRRAGLSNGKSLFEELQSDALIRIERKGENWHWAVWNSEGKCVHDPLLGIPKRFPARVTGYYLVTKP